MGQGTPSLRLAPTPHHALLGVLDVSEPLAVLGVVVTTMFPLARDGIEGVEGQEGPPVVSHKTDRLQDKIGLLVRHEVGDRKAGKTGPISGSYIHKLLCIRITQESPNNGICFN